MDADLDLLTSLVGDLDHFAEHHWGHWALHRHSGGETFEDLLSVDAIEDLLLTSARTPTFRLVQDGATLPRDRSTRRVRLGGKDLDDVADLARIAAAVDDGATLVMQALHRTTLPIARFCRSLERATSHPVQANAYLSPGGGAGLRSHTDEHHVLALQLVGAKRWVVDGLGAVRTEAGDVLYIPPGTRHEAEAQDGPSLHLTIGIIRVTVGQAVQRALAPTDVLRSSLPLGYARPEREAELRRRVQEAVDAASAALAAIDPAAIAAVERARADRRRPALATGQLASVLALAALDRSSRVGRRDDVEAVLEPDTRREGRVVLVLPDRRIDLPDAMGPAVELLLEQPIVRIGELPGLDDGSRLVLVRRLIREGLLRVGPPD